MSLTVIAGVTPNECGGMSESKPDQSDTVRRRRHSPGVSIYTRYVSFDSAGRQTLTAVGLSVIEV